MAGIELSSPPAFGYEYQGCNANNVRAERYRGEENPQERAKTAQWASNFFKLLGVVMPLVGVVRMFDAVISDDKNKVFHFLRGLAEALGGGVFLLGADIAVTIGREIIARFPESVQLHTV